MKKTIIFIILFSLIACKNQTEKKQLVSTENDAVVEIQYSENELISFLDSIGQINPDSWVEELLFIVDSVLTYQTSLNCELTAQDFEKLKTALREDRIDVKFAKHIFPDLTIDSCFISASAEEYPIFVFSFDNNEDDFEKFAIQVGYTEWENDVYFFCGKKIIAKHSIYHRYGFKPKHFKNENNQTVIFYTVNYGSGSGIWWHQFNFYQYNKDQLVPVLTEIQNINLQFTWSIRAYWIESEIVNERPLQLKFVYNNQFFYRSETDFFHKDFINDSTIVTYYIDTQSGKYIPNFNDTKQNRNKLTSYFHSDNELLFVNAHYGLFKNRLNKNDTIMRKSILDYLNELKNYFER